MTLSGPLNLVQGFYGVIVRQPVFVRGSAPNATFGVPDPLPNPACGEPCTYNSSTGLFWGFVSVTGSEPRLCQPLGTQGEAWGYRKPGRRAARSPAVPPSARN